MPDRTIRAPEQEYLTDAEAAAWLSIHVEDFREYVKMGLIPKGIPHGKRVSAHRWPWMDVVAVGHLFNRGHLRLPGMEDKESPK